MLISKFPPIGSLTKPLCGLVLHFGEGGSSSLPNETAWLSASLSSLVTGPPVRVYVSHSSLQTMRDVYARLGGNVIVEPLFLHNSELDAAAILSMMAVGSTESAPLYMQIILVRHSFFFILFSNFVLLVYPPRTGRKVYLFRFYEKIGGLKAEVQCGSTNRFGTATFVT